MLISKRYIKHIVIFIIILVIGSFIIDAIQEKVMQDHLRSQNELLKSKYDTNYKFLKIMSQDIYDMYKENPEVIDTLSKVKNASPHTQNELRRKLYEVLKKRYKRLQNMGVLQLQFHLPNNHSFLRMNHPDKFGDDLSTIRDTIATTNKTLKPAEGFEFGKTVYGFRFVYPLFDKDHKHIGSIGISYSSGQLLKVIDGPDILDAHFLVYQKDVHENINDYDKSGKFREAKQYSNFYSDKSAHKMGEDVEKFEELFSDDTVKLINDHMKKEFPFAVVAKQNSKNFLIRFLPVKNSKENKTLAYLNTISSSEYLNDLEETVFTYRSFFYILFVLFFVFGIIVIKKTA
jgi:hypothetical protein